MDDLQVTVRHISAILASLPIKCHFTGGIASSFYGEPRFTQDVDIVVHIEPEDTALSTLVDALAATFFIDAPAVHEAVKRQDMFQALDNDTFIKVDFHVGEAIPGELSRSRTVEVFPGISVPLVSREDAILSKLLWVRQGSHKSRQDARMMLARPGDVDRDYLNSQALALGVDTLLHDIECGTGAHP